MDLARLPTHPFAGWSSRWRPSAPWFLVMAFTGMSGLAWSLANAAPGALADQGSLSRLGIDPNVASIFNATAISVGLLCVILAYHLRHDLQTATQVGALVPGIARIIELSLYAIPVALVVSGIFSVAAEPAHLIHNVAGFTPPVVMLFLMSGAAWTVPGSRRFDQMSFAVALLVATLFVIAKETTLVPYASMEIVGFLACGSWLWLAEGRWRALAAPLGEHS